MNKKYIVRLTDEERAICEATVKKEKGKSESCGGDDLAQGPGVRLNMATK